MDAREILHQARAGVEEVSGRLVDLLVALPTAAAPVSPEWSIRDVAAHLVSGTALYTELACGTPSPLDDVSPEAFRRFSAERIADIAEVEPAALAKSLADAVGQFVEAVGSCSVDTPIRWHGGVRLDPAQLTGTLLGEFVLHGFDIAAAVGAPWPIDPAHAALTLYGYGPVYPACVDPSTSRGHSAGYELDLGIAGRLTARFVDGAVSVGPADGGEIDCVISADPRAFLMVMSGRLEQATAIALGLLGASGARPDLGLGFGRLFRYP